MAGRGEDRGFDKKKGNEKQMTVQRGGCVFEREREIGWVIVYGEDGGGGGGGETKGKIMENQKEEERERKVEM